MASISKTGSNGHHTFKLEVTEKSTSTANNTSSVSFSFTISSPSGGWRWEGWGSKISYEVIVNGSKYTGTIPNFAGNTTVTLKSDTFDIKHDTDGSKSISFSFSVTDTTGQSYTCGNASANGTMTLTKIPRYLTITKCYVWETLENQVDIYWETSDPRDATYYSLDNGTTWKGSATYGEILGGSGKSGRFTVGELTANTTYNIKVKIKRADSQLWTEKALTFTTYDYPYCTSMPDFTLGDAVTLKFYNPLNRGFYFYIIGNGTQIDCQYWCESTTYTGVNNFETSVSCLYATIPNNQSGRYNVKVVYGSSAITKTGGTYKIKGNEIPTINAFDYEDGNESIYTITGNKKHIVQNKSNLLAMFHSATANYGAGSIAKYKVECNEKSAEGSKAGTYELGAIDSANDVDLKLTVTDSRGLSASKTIKVTMLEHSKPNAIVTLQRLNNYEDETYLTVDGSISSVNGKNTMTIQYRYKLSGGNYGDGYDTLEDRETKTFPNELSKNNEYIFEIVVTDKFGSQFIKEYVLGKGVFPLFIDTRLNSVGVNKFPKYDKSLEAWGLVSLGERANIRVEVGDSIEIPVFLLLCSGLVNFRISSANLEVARLFYVFRSNQYFGVHKTLVDESYGNTSAVVPMEMRNATEGYIFKITNNHSSPIDIRYGILELC